MIHGLSSLLSTPWIAASYAVIVSLFAFIAIGGVGAWFPSQDKLNAWGLGLACQGFCVGTLGLAGVPLKILAGALLLAGLLGLPRLAKLPWDAANSASITRPDKSWSMFAFILIGALLVSRFLFALYPQLQSDPLAYHVTSAKVWATQGTLTSIPWLPWALQGGIFEYYYTLLAMAIQDPLTLLLACQASHVLFGSCLVAVIVFSVARLIGLSINTAMLVVLAAILFPIDSLMMIRAKNDGVTLLFSILALRALLQGNIPMVGVFTGSAIATKWSALFFALPFLVMVSVQQFKKKNHRDTLLTLSTLALLIILTSAPIALRNWLWTDNPMFPSMGRLFSSPLLTPSLIAEIDRFTSAGTWYEGLFQKASWYIWSVPAVFLALATPIVRTKLPLNLLFILASSILLFFAASTGTAAYPRFVLVAGILFSLCAGSVWELQNKSWASWVVLIGILSGTGIDVPISNVVKRSIPFWFSTGTTADFLNSESKLIHFQNQINNLNLSPRPIILGCHENEALFLNGGETIPSNHAGGSRALMAENPRHLAQVLIKERFSHLLIRRDIEVTCWSRFLQDPTFGESFNLVLQDELYGFYRPK